MLPTAAKSRRILFLDDDPNRAAVFLMENPEAIWVQTAKQCLSALVDPWDEIHLDHDLGGEVFVDHEREDCGMEVVRWLCEEPRAHLLTANFIVHTRNPNASCVMQFHLEVLGYRVQVRPFGQQAPFHRAAINPSMIPRPRMARIIGWIRQIGGL